MSVLVTGGAGYIGSHVVKLLEDRGDEIVIIDDCSTGLPARVANHSIVKLDLASESSVEVLTEQMSRLNVESVIHFAAKKHVGESTDYPVWYYRQNVGGLANLLEAMGRAAVNELVFSSSAAVYGTPDGGTVSEETQRKPINPYGETKLVGEWLIDAEARRRHMKCAVLRYFNVAGAGDAGLADNAAMNLIPIVLERYRKGLQPVIFGDDYPTSDGTGIRDYIHVVDLANAHISALDSLKRDRSGTDVFNVGTGSGSSVLEVVNEISLRLGVQLEPVVAGRRSGDPAEVTADASKIAVDLGWKAQFGLAEIIESDISARRLAN